ncbi:transposase, IS3 family [Bathymodiolus japonicus methanotrophic gill symbiont]|uniref:transposase n=1 Tax=Bathymodiolus japonicus methanotrophic gill symbiont TaxID=113269 RepID=UPI001B620617|nr:transposase [Bathymodiolus japonicus methanotrophic gill symbiont]GFO70987.1 transposase, IS3 family [Bathymodiolus japonicus methanotrophic gill symbiont]
MKNNNSNKGRKNKTMTTQYPKERKDAIINKMLPPLSMSVPELAKAENIPYGTLYTWKQTYVDKKCKNTKNTSHSPIQWTAEKKLSAIIETSTLSEQECNEYCRTHGLYKAELESWKTHFIKGSEQNVTQEKTDRNVLKQLRSENKKLKKELNRKEKALAETAALLVLRKKMDALWEENEDA